MAEKTPLKTVLITGGATGIGFATAKRLLALGGFRVILLGRNRSKLEKSFRDLGGDPDQVLINECDLSNEGDIRKTAEWLKSSHIGLDGLVNNAGVYPFGGASNTSSESWDETFAVNLKAPFLLIQSTLELLSRSSGGGRIINVASTAGLLPNHFALAYSVSKAGLVHMTKTLAKELGKHNITVNCICPGIVRTPLHEAYHQSQSELEEFYGRRGSTFPLGRVGEPEDVAGAIEYFLSPGASWVTGDVLVVDGGRLLL